MSDEPMEPKRKSAKHRSPNYPAISLGRALELAEMQYQKDKLQYVPVSITFGRWGYKKGHGNLYLAALKAFSLVNVSGVGDKQQVAISEVARRIILKAPDRGTLIRQAALSPPIHSELWETYRGTLPQDDVLRDHLVFERKFNENAVDGFIAQFRDTISLANMDESHISDADYDDGLQDATDLNYAPKSIPESLRRRVQELSQSLEETNFRLPSGTAVFFLPENMTDADYEILEGYLKLHKQASEQSIKIDKTE